MYTDSRGVQARLEMAMLSQDARMKTCLTACRTVPSSATRRASPTPWH
jgi:hypothetical protein